MVDASEIRRGTSALGQRGRLRGHDVRGPFDGHQRLFTASRCLTSAAPFIVLVVIMLCIGPLPQNLPRCFCRVLRLWPVRLCGSTATARQGQAGVGDFHLDRRARRAGLARRLTTSARFRPHAPRHRPSTTRPSQPTGSLVSRARNTLFPLLTQRPVCSLQRARFLLLSLRVLPTRSPSHVETSAAEVPTFPPVAPARPHLA